MPNVSWMRSTAEGKEVTLLLYDNRHIDPLKRGPISLALQRLTRDYDLYPSRLCLSSQILTLYNRTLPDTQQLDRNTLHRGDLSSR